ncbi:hypothetical protein [Mycobacterium sp. 1274761.0]|uniref:hypothetical protein n=1 Tax=Mycobacterium sp. 1274761.0 TaxID=1834077 RepID=UPI0007FC5D7F|nr:hypothetical protein [Mycobacterium sp. 1274761.0]OBK71790.1 hypothetical protein A5651_18215 [Mycobacterium sp. 1274761.0]
MRKVVKLSAFAVTALLVASPAAHADRVEPPPLYGYYNLFVDFAKQTFNGTPTPMDSKTFPVLFTTNCDVNGCVVRMDNSDDHARNPGAPLAYEYRWTGDRWATSGEYPYFCDRSDPNSAVAAQRSDYWVPNPDGSFFGVRTLVVEGAGCPGEGPGTHTVPIALTPVDPPPST